MRARRKLLIAGFVATGLALVACGAHHARHAHGPEAMQKFVSHRVEDALDDIDATEVQRTKVNEVKERLFAELRAVHDGSKPTRREALAQWRSNQPDAKKLHELVDQRAAAYQRALHQAVDGLLEVHASLTPQQREQLAQRFEERMHD